MKLEDESILSAYLDDELDAAERRLVEDALGDDPDLARRLDDLRWVRDQVAGLSRMPASDETALNVVVAIDKRRRYSLLMLTTAALATAAGLFLALLPPRFFHSPDHVPGGLLLTNKGTPAGPQDPVGSEDPPPPERPAPGTGAVLLTEGPARDRLSKLEGASARRLIVPVANLDAGTIGRLDRDVHELARLRPEYVRVPLPESQTADPEHSGPAVVFALEAHPEELEPLLARLSNSPVLQGTIRADKPGPEVLRALALAKGPELAEGKRGAPVRTEKLGPELRELLMFLKVPRPDAEAGPVAPGPKTTEGPKALLNDGTNGPFTVLIWIVPG